MGPCLGFPREPDRRAPHHCRGVVDAALTAAGPAGWGCGSGVWVGVQCHLCVISIATINRAGARKVLLSGHDTCDHALERMTHELDAETAVLEAGGTYRL